MTGALLLKQSDATTRISYYHLLAFMASLPFNFFYSHIILISLSLHTLINLNRKEIGDVFTWHNMALVSVFFITTVSAIYTINYPQAFADLGRHMVILLFPVLFCISGFDFRAYRDSLLLGFGLICTAVIAYLYFDALYTIRYYGLPLSAIATASFTNHNFAQPIEIHATFLSLQIGIGLVFMLSEAINKTGNARLLYSLCAALLLAGLIQLSSKSVVLPVFVIINFVVPFFLLQGTARTRYTVIAVSISVLIIAAIFTFRFLKTRYVANLQYDLELTTRDAMLDSRLDRWHAAAHLIKQKPIIGYGAGAELNLLHEEFYARKYYSSFLHHLNVHNQYLSLWLKSGIVGLLVYLATLWFGFKQALKRKNLLFFCFMLMIAAVSFSENFLDVDKGVVFYAFFFSFFMFSSDSNSSVERGAIA